MRLLDESLRKRTVIGADGLAIGEVSGLFLNSATWSVESLQVKLRREVADQIGAARGLFHAGVLEIPTRLVQSVGDAIILSVAVTELRHLLPREDEPASAHYE
jgi:sporulation protein YlmC with PRC-barrel domain